MDRALAFRNMVKSARFAALYGASVETMSEIIGSYTKETRDMKQKRMIKHRGRIKLKHEQVFHFGKSGSANYACFVCGAPAMHQVRAVNDGSTGYKQGDLYLCTCHFVQIFSLPPNRHPKVQWVGGKRPAPKAQEPDANGNFTYTLRRFMQPPVVVTGKRLICHHAEIAFTDWFFSLYREVMPRQQADRYVITCTRVMKKKRGKLTINLVRSQPEFGNLSDTSNVVLGMLQTMDEFVPFEKATLCEHIMVQEAATDFIEQVTMLGQ